MIWRSDAINLIFEVKFDLELRPGSLANRTKGKVSRRKFITARFTMRTQSIPDCLGDGLNFMTHLPFIWSKEPFGEQTTIITSWYKPYILKICDLMVLFLLKTILHLPHPTQKYGIQTFRIISYCFLCLNIPYGTALSKEFIAEGYGLFMASKIENLPKAVSNSQLIVYIWNTATSVKITINYNFKVGSGKALCQIHCPNDFWLKFWQTFPLKNIVFI